MQPPNFDLLVDGVSFQLKMKDERKKKDIDLNYVLMFR